MNPKLKNWSSLLVLCTKEIASRNSWRVRLWLPCKWHVMEFLQLFSADKWKGGVVCPPQRFSFNYYQTASIHAVKPNRVMTVFALFCVLWVVDLVLSVKQKLSARSDLF